MTGITTKLRTFVSGFDPGRVSGTQVLDPVKVREAPGIASTVTRAARLVFHLFVAFIVRDIRRIWQPCSDGAELQRRLQVAAVAGVAVGGTALALGSAGSLWELGLLYGALPAVASGEFPPPHTVIRSGHSRSESSGPTSDQPHCPTVGPLSPSHLMPPGKSRVAMK